MNVATASSTTNSSTSTTVPRLTSLSHGGGCGCKIAPGVLSEILKSSSMNAVIPPELMVGIETADDAAVYQLNESQALVATTDFFMPIVDDPYEFGRIAATNALSDVYAMGGKPIMALALVAMPINVLPLETIGAIVRGGQDVCRAAGIPIAGGHTIDSVEPIYGLVAMGLVHPSRVRRNAAAKDRRNHPARGYARKRGPVDDGKTGCGNAGAEDAANHRMGCRNRRAGPCGNVDPDRG